MNKILRILVLVALPLSANSLPSEKRKNGPMIQKALSPVQVSLQESSAVFYNNENSKLFIYGTVVSEDGLILTKASELEEVKDYHVRVGTKKYRSPKLISRNDSWDVALVKIEAEGLKSVDLESKIEVNHGTWIVSNGATERRFRRPRAGIVSANKREIPGGSPAVLGVSLNAKDEKLLVGNVTKESGAEKAGLKEGDELLEVDGTEINDRDSFIKYLTSKSPGNVIKLKVKRAEETLDFEVELMARHKLFGGTQNRNDQLSGGETQQSPRRTGFPMVLQHETTLSRRTVGGPIFTLDGEFVGMNIAAANRVEVFAIPVEELAKIVEGFQKSS
ncbi:MAG: serine protease Do [Akkermansiaceae bacterium]|jgi:serine protease Do